MTLSEILRLAQLFIAPFILFLFSLITAYVFKFSVKRSGIQFDYMLFVVYVVLAMLIGGVI